MKHTFSFHLVNWEKVEIWRPNFAWRRQVDQFGVITARPRLGTCSITTSRVGGKKFLILQTMPHTSTGQENVCRGCCPFYAMAKLKKYAKGPTESFQSRQKCCQLWGGLLWPRSVGIFISQLRGCNRTFAWLVWKFGEGAAKSPSERKATLSGIWSWPGAYEWISWSDNCCTGLQRPWKLNHSSYPLSFPKLTITSYDKCKKDNSRDNSSPDRQKCEA